MSERETLHGPVKIYQLSPEELEKYRNMPRKKYFVNGKENPAFMPGQIEWEWRAGRKKEGE
jgi:hypothetical protein